MVDINKLGKEYEIYTTVDYIGRGFPIILPRGARIIRTLRNMVEKEEESKGYKVVRTPSISNSQIYKKEDRYAINKNKLFVIKNSEAEEKNEIVLKPYVQPFHCTIFKEKHHSYKELPIKYCETSTVFRKERDVKGILRTRQITMSDASIFCEPNKIEGSIKDAIELQRIHIEHFDLSVSYVISTWKENEKENYIGKIEEWNSVVQAMKNVLDKLNIRYTIDNTARMYGPAIKVMHNDKVFLRTEIDFEITHRFDVRYTDSDNTDKFPLYIHYTVVGSYEQLLAMLLERFKGDFPLWIAPTQVVIICENSKYDYYSLQIQKEFANSGIRAEIDNTAGKLQSKIKQQQKLKVPYIIIVDKKGFEEGNIKILSKNTTDYYKITDAIREVKQCLKQF